MRPLKLSIRSKSLIVTSLGWRFILLMMAIGIAAINTGNNLLYLILAMMLSMMVISGVLSEACLYRLHFRRHLPDAIYAGQPVKMGFTVSNRKKVIPSFSLLVTDSVEGLSSSMTKNKYFFKLPPGSSKMRTYPLCFRQRGIYPLKGVSFSTRFPFGIFLKIRHDAEKSNSKIVVYPRVFNLFPPRRQGTRSGVHVTPRRGYGASLHQFRAYLPGDDARAIHWKTSARKQKLMVKECEDEEEKRITVGILERSEAPPSKADFARFEKAIELAASLASYYAGESYKISVATGQANIPPGKGPEHLREILTLLASLKVVYPAKSLPELNVIDGTPMILVSPFQQLRKPSRLCSKIYQPEEIDRLPFWSKA